MMQIGSNRDLYPSMRAWKNFAFIAKAKKYYANYCTLNEIYRNINLYKSINPPPPPKISYVYIIERTKEWFRKRLGIDMGGHRPQNGKTAF